MKGEELTAQGELIVELQRASGLNETWAWNCWNLIGTSRWRVEHDKAVRAEAFAEVLSILRGTYTDEPDSHGSGVSALWVGIQWLESHLLKSRDVGTGVPPVG